MTRALARTPVSHRLRSATGSLLGVRFVRFCLVGTSGYFINLCVYKLLIDLLNTGPITAAVCAFLAAATSNYNLNRRWTFDLQFPTIWSIVGFGVVALTCLGLNVLLLKIGLSEGVGALPAQAMALIAVVPFNFTATRLMFSLTKRDRASRIWEVCEDHPGINEALEPPEASSPERVVGKH